MNFYLKAQSAPPIFFSLTLSFILHFLLVIMVITLPSKSSKEKERAIPIRIHIEEELSSPTTEEVSVIEGKGDIDSKSTTPETKNRSLRSQDYTDIIEERLHAIKAKKRIEKIVKLRAEIKRDGSATGRSLLPRPEISSGTGSYAKEAGGKEKSIEDYRHIIERIIHSNWTYPEMARKGLKGSAVIFIKRDGALEIRELNSSGDRLFDYSMRNSLLKSSLPPPPEEMEVEVRFSE